MSKKKLLRFTANRPIQEHNLYTLAVDTVHFIQIINIEQQLEFGVVSFKHVFINLK